jgi:hypothetical protein
LSEAATPSTDVTPCPPPPIAEGRHRWPTRNEAARLLGAAVGFVWDNERGTWKRKEDGTLSRRERWIIRRRYAAARFCLIGVYSARRETIRRTQWLSTTTPPWINLDAMVYQGQRHARVIYWSDARPSHQRNDYIGIADAKHRRLY